MVDGFNDYRFYCYFFTLVLFVKLDWNKNKKVNHKYNDLRNKISKNSSENSLVHEWFENSKSSNIIFNSFFNILL